ncbi:hypothetical protein GIS00_22390 [Nakamurella sp. YIM 132087]|uniref:Uncharacterized protein n=1 Tax=Nakamurella alba TaxID=2665158 RepID=A0A7K1FTH4_9ACTN|nr:hypothetical protein [Nakamurella alba]MTD16689.1 hypothetical protein [Nakamurella alba]
MRAETGERLMARKMVVFSDLTGKEIGRPENVAQLRVLQHPELDTPVRLDVDKYEVLNLASTNVELVTLELVIPDTPPERIVLTVEDFGKLFQSGNAAEALKSASQYAPDPVDDLPRARFGASVAQRSAPKPATAKIDYSSLEHAGTPHRGRITENEKATVRANLDAVNDRLREAGQRVIDLENPELVAKYDLEVLRQK